MTISTRILLTGLGVAALLTGCVQRVEDALPKPARPAIASTRPPVAIVEGHPISAEVFDLFVSAQTHGRKTAELPPEVRQRALDELIRVYVARAQAEKQGIDAKPEIAARLDVSAATLLADQLNSAFLQGKEPTEAEMRAEYDSAVAGMPKVEYRARHVLVATEKEARDVITALGRGANIADIAKQASLDGGSKQQGGDLGWFAAERMVKPFAAALVALKKGEYTQQPVQSNFGWHVIRLEDSRPLTPPPLDQVREQLKHMVQQKQLETYLDGLATNMKIERKL
jgi:peptidyl-prolyl cis-trans isomerase C